MHSSASLKRLELLLQLHGFEMTVLLVQGGKLLFCKVFSRQWRISKKKRSLSPTGQKKKYMVCVSLFRVPNCSLTY